MVAVFLPCTSTLPYLTWQLSVAFGLCNKKYLQEGAVLVAPLMLDIYPTMAANVITSSTTYSYFGFKSWSRWRTQAQAHWQRSAT